MSQARGFAKKDAIKGGIIRMRPSSDRITVHVPQPPNVIHSTRSEKNQQRLSKKAKEYEKSNANHDTDRELADPQWLIDETMDGIMSDMHLALENEQLALWDTMCNEDRLVFGDGNMDSEVMVLGEAPGYEESLCGNPLVGPSGKMIEELFRTHNLDMRTNTFITNVVKIFPYYPNNRGRSGGRRTPRPPTMNEVRSHLPYLVRQIQRLAPKVIFCFGKFSANIILAGLDLLKLSKSKNINDLDFELAESIGKLQNEGPKVIRLEGVPHAITLVPLFHPSFILRQENHEQIETLIRWKFAFKTGLEAVSKPPILIPEGFHSKTLYQGKYKCPLDVKWRKPSDIFWERPLPSENYLKYIPGESNDKLSFEVTGLAHNEFDNITVLYGRTLEGYSVRCNVEEFKFSFFTEIPKKFDFWSKSASNRKYCDMNAAIKGMKDEVVAKLGKEIGLTFEKHQDHYGYRCRYKPLKYYAKFETETHSNIKAVTSIVRELYGETTKCYQVDTSPNLDFTYGSGIKAYSWVEIPKQQCTTIWIGSKRSNYCGTNPVDIEISASIKNIISHSPTDPQWSHHAPLRFLAFDIECVSDRLGFPRPEEDPIICICFELQLQSEKTIVDPKSGICKENVFFEFIIGDCATLPGRDNDVICEFETEKDMLGAFCSLLRQCDPDVVDGYNSDRFDFWYVLKRAETLNLKPADGWLPFGRDNDIPVTVTDKIFQSRAFGTRINRIIDMRGRDNFDVMVDFMRNKKMRAYGLADVSQELLGKTKNDMPYVSIRGYFLEDNQSRSKLLDYCKRDTHLVSCLRNSQKLILAGMELSRQTGSIFLRELNIQGQQIKVYSALRHKIVEAGGRNIIPSHLRNKNGGSSGSNSGYSSLPENEDDEIVETYIVNGETGRSGQDEDDGSDGEEEGEKELLPVDVNNSQQPIDDPMDCEEYENRTQKHDSTRVIQTEKVSSNASQCKKSVTNRFVAPKRITNRKGAKPGVLPVVGSGKGVQSSISAWMSAKPSVAQNSGVDAPQKFTEKEKNPKNTNVTSQSTDASVPRDAAQNKSKKTKAAYSGAVVLEPVIGLHKDPTLCSDFASMYPSIMITHNLCHSTALYKCQLEKEGFPPHMQTEEYLECPPETFVHKGCKVCGPGRQKVYFVKSSFLATFYESDLDLQRKEYALFGINFDSLIEPTGTKGIHPYRWRNHSFCSEAEKENAAENMYRFKESKRSLGMFPLALKDILAARSIAKKQRDTYPPGSLMYMILEQRQLALKIMANSGYGASGAERGKLSEIRIGASVTAYGRDYITDCRDRALDYFTKGVWKCLTEKMGSTVEETFCSGGDTDSWFLHPGFVFTVAQGIEFGPRAVQYQNRWLRGSMELAFEKVLWPFYVFKRKRYSGGLYSGEFNSCFFEKLRWLELHVPQHLWETILSINDWYKKDNIFFENGIHWWHVPEGVVPGSKADPKNPDYKWDTQCPIEHTWGLRLDKESKRRAAQTDEEWIADYEKPRYEGPLVNTADYGKITNKGTEAVRRDASPFLKRLAGTFLNMVLMEGKIIDSIMYVRENIRALLDGRVSECDLIMSKQISKTLDQYSGSTQAHVSLAQRMEASGRNPPDIGERLAFLMTKPPKDVVTTNSRGKRVRLKQLESYKCSETPEEVLVKGLEIDFLWYIENQCTKPICRLLKEIMSHPKEILFKFDSDTLHKASKQKITPGKISEHDKKNNSFLNYAKFESLCNLCKTKYNSPNPMGICDSCLHVDNYLPLKRFMLKHQRSVKRAQLAYDEQMKICVACTKLEEAPCNNSRCSYFPVRMKLAGVTNNRKEKLSMIESSIKHILIEAETSRETWIAEGELISKNFPNRHKKLGAEYVRNFEDLAKGLSFLGEKKRPRQHRSQDEPRSKATLIERTNSLHDSISVNN